MNAAARTAVQTRFTTLLHHVDIAALERAFRRQRRQASAGIDGVTVAMYAQDLELNLRDLCARIHTGRYRPQPVRRVYIPKADGGQRPLGVPTLEDKIVQGAVAEVLSAIYEVDFLGFSYGFRPGRNPHQALSAVHTAIMSQRVKWVLDADIRSFFDSVDHEWLLRMLAHRIADPRILRLIRQWLEAGILDGHGHPLRCGGLVNPTMRFAPWPRPYISAARRLRELPYKPAVAQVHFRLAAFAAPFAARAPRPRRGISLLRQFPANWEFLK